MASEKQIEYVAHIIQKQRELFLRRFKNRTFQCGGRFDEAAAIAAAEAILKNLLRAAPEKVIDAFVNGSLEAATEKRSFEIEQKYQMPA